MRFRSNPLLGQTQLDTLLSQPGGIESDLLLLGIGFLVFSLFLGGSKPQRRGKQDKREKTQKQIHRLERQIEDLKDEL